MLDITTIPTPRVQESFIGNDKKTVYKKSKKQLGRGVSAIKEAPKKIKTRRATLSQKQCVWALTNALYNNKELASQVSKTVAKSFDLATKKIQELNQIQESRKNMRGSSN